MALKNHLHAVEQVHLQLPLYFKLYPEIAEHFEAILIDYLAARSPEKEFHINTCWADCSEDAVTQSLKCERLVIVPFTPSAGTAKVLTFSEEDIVIDARTAATLKACRNAGKSIYLLRPYSMQSLRQGTPDCYITPFPHLKDVVELSPELEDSAHATSCRLLDFKMHSVQ